LAANARKNARVLDTTQEELNESLVDLAIFKNGHYNTIANATELVRTACLNHGFLQVTVLEICPKYQFKRQN